MPGRREQPYALQPSPALNSQPAASGPPSAPSSFSVCSLPSVLPSIRPSSPVPQLPLSCHFRAAFPWPPPQPQLLSGTHRIALHMKMSCHIFQPLKHRLFLGEVVLTVLPCSSQAEHKAGYANAGGEEEGGHSNSTHMQGGTESLWGDTKLPWGTGVKKHLSLPTSEGCSFPTQGQLLATLLQDTGLR